MSPVGAPCGELYAEIILPVAGPCYTFSVEGGLAASVREGSAVSVQFGVRKIVTGVVRRLVKERPPYKNIKPVLSLLLPQPLVSAEQLKLWDWMAQYYMCSPGEVMRAALPSLLKPSGLTPGEFSAEGFRPRRVKTVSLAPSIDSEERLNEICEGLRRRAPRQYEALVEIAGGAGGEVLRGDLDADGAALSALQKKGLIVVGEREVDGSSPGDGPTTFKLPELSASQRRALEQLHSSLRSKEVALLFGVPSSGKSEIAFHAIADTLARGRDVLLLLPEISLTTQFVRRVGRVFGERVVVYHSGLEDRRRAEAYLRLARRGSDDKKDRGDEDFGASGTQGSLIVGARSALFLPLRRLGLVVVDEEQDPSYKQQDPAPRYNARDTAIVLARLHDARVILASATPSLETWANAAGGSDGGRYGFVELSERFGGTPPPEVIISDTLRAVKRGERRSHFNKELLDEMGRTLGRGEQIILFQNRRGVAPWLECPDCGHVPTCGHCGIPMSVHRDGLRCHYCGAVSALPVRCPSCEAEGILTRGFGTEKIEGELARLFPSARVARLDRDSATSETAYRRLIDGFERGEADILVGTQMVTKGLDFPGVTLVGILNADNLLNHPDFRASERAWQLMAQVAGRAGRRGERGRVVIQTSSPDSRLIAQASAGDYRGMASDALAERALWGYPPYSRLISVMLRHPDRDTLYAAAQIFRELLCPAFGERLLGPAQPVVERIRGEYALVFLLKVPRERPMSQVRRVLSEAIAALRSRPVEISGTPGIAAPRGHNFRRLTVTPDVDPQ